MIQFRIFDIEKNHIFSLVLFAAIIALSSCSIEKRIYQPGYFISGRSNSPKEAKIQKPLQSARFSESITTIADADSSQVIINEDYAEIKVNEPFSIIEASKETKSLLDEIPITNTIGNDSIPEESNLSNEEYEKNHTLLEKIKKIGYLQVALFCFGFSLVLLICFPSIVVPYQAIISSLLICLAAIILLEELRGVK